MDNTLPQRLVRRLLGFGLGRGSTWLVPPSVSWVRSPAPSPVLPLPFVIEERRGVPVCGWSEASSRVVFAVDIASMTYRATTRPKG